MHLVHLTILLCNCIWTRHVGATYCNDSLGMGDKGKMKNSQITAQGAHDKNAAADTARLGRTGWCVNNEEPHGFNKDKYLQVDLLKIHRVTGLVIKGKDHFNAGSKIKLSQKINPNDDFTGNEIATNNRGPSEKDYIQLTPPFDTRYIKYQPYIDDNPKCIQMDLLGCQLPEKLESTCLRDVLKSSMSYSASSEQKNGQSKMAARYIVKGSPFAWGPDKENTTNRPYGQYVEADLGDKYLLTGVQTFKASYYNGGATLLQPPNFMISFKIKGVNWTPYTGETNLQYEFSTTETLRSRIEIKPPIAARYIRVRPKIVEDSKAVYLKMQFYGCILKDAFDAEKTTNAPTTKAATKPLKPTKKIASIAPTQKRLPEAIIESYDIRQGSRFNDDSYKGSLAQGVLHGGKGSLSDGVISKKSPFEQPRLWVGWDKHHLSHPYIIINLAEFSIVKSIEFVSYEDRKNNIAPFSSCKIQFSKNERYLWSDDLHACPQRKNPSGIVVLRIDLVQKNAGRIRVSFNYSSQLLVFSEINLNTEKKSSVENLEATASMCQKASFKVVAGEDKSSSSLTLILVLIIVFLLIIIIIVLVYRYRQKISAKICGNKHGTLVETKHGMNGNNDQLAVTFTANPNYDTSGKDDVEHMYAEVREGPEHDEKRPFLPNMDHSIMLQEEPSAVEHDEFYESTYAAPDEPGVGYTEVDVSPNSDDKIPDYSVPDLGFQDNNVELNPIYEGAKIYEDPYQTVTGSSLYADPTVEKERSSIEIKKFPRNRLHFLEKIGAGQFGEVHICEVESLGSIIGKENLECSWLMTRNVKVAVKLLKEGVEKCVEKEFMKEVRVMARLRHENVVQLLGVCEEEPKCMVVEYMENGDLNQFLKKFHRPNMEQPYEDQPDALNEETILHICMQIAAGMRYLASQGFIHRDLATRNCLVGHSFTVKVSDFGMSRYLYSKQYYKIEGRAVLPIRWMAPESLFYGTFTSQTDVWAFGVTLWEVFTFARDTPYEHLNDQQVIENACSVVAKQRSSFKCLQQPQGCPINVYNILLSCWERSPADRPSFDELCRYFQSVVNTTEECI